MGVSLLILGATIALLLTGLWIICQIRYRIGNNHFQIRCLGIPVKKIPLTRIRKISKHRPARFERWPNSLKPRKRALYLELSGDPPKFVMVTPEHRYVFKAKLKRAVYYAKKELGTFGPNLQENELDDPNENESDE
jgi:hypothetical protein